jgi:hypothetical protein
LQPGECISIDQYISAQPGRLPHTKGKESKSDQYNGGTLFVDHASGYIFLRNQVSLTAGETLRAKKSFEQFASSVGVSLQRFHADNVPFNSKEFRRNLETNGQPIVFSGTGAHHQNGVAERAIQTVTKWARAMLLHSILMWPDQADLSLWPFALDHAVYLWNNLPTQVSRLAPIEIFTSTRFPNYSHLRRLHVWGCPVYVLDPKLQDGHKIPKWSPRSRRGKFLGVSTSHSTTIGLILNLRTGFVSPQYHVVYDDEFTTVPNAESGGLFNADNPFSAAQWQRLVASGSERVIVSDDDVLPALHRDWTPPPPPALPLLVPPIPPVTVPEGENLQQQQQHATAPFGPDVEPLPPLLFAPEGDAGADPLPPLPPALDPPIVDPIAPENPPAHPPLPIRTRSGRQVRRPNRLIETMLTYHPLSSLSPSNAYENPKRSVRSSLYNNQFLMALNWFHAVESLRSVDHSAMMNVIDKHTDVDHNTVEWMHPMILSAKANAEDNPTWDQVMNGPDREGYLEAMRKELATLSEDKDAWDVVDRQDWMKVLPTTWAFRCKRYPDGRIGTL